MAKNKYQLHLKGYVGSWDFDADYVDYILGKNPDKEVAVLIDSPGGQLNTALSISSAFKRHGNVHAHFVGMNASAATIASMGAKHITMDKSAMYLVHQCALPFFEYGNLNATGMSQLIESLGKAKTDLEKMDANVATMYATRCKKEPKALLDLMKVGGWLTAQEALDWGFVDELTEFEDETAPVLTASLAADFQANGIPLPNVPKSKSEETLFQKMAQALAAVFKPTQVNNQHTPKPMNIIFKNICKFLSCEHLASEDGKVSLTEAQLSDLESAMQANHDMIAELSIKVKNAEDENKKLTETNKSLDEANKTLEAKVANLPAASTTTIVDDKKHEDHEPTAYEQFINAGETARKLYDSLP